MAQVAPAGHSDEPHLTPVAYHAKPRDRYLFERFITGELLPIIILCVVVFAGMIWMVSAAFLTKYLTSFPVWIFFKLAALNLPQPIVISLPMAMLLGAILGFQKLSTDSEAVSMLASGISFYQMLKPTVVIGIVVALIGLWINNSLVPFATHQLTDMKTHLLNDPSASTAATHPFDLPDLRNHDGHLQATVHVEGGYDSYKRALRGITINEFDPTTGHPTAVIFADKARWSGGETWELYDVTTFTGTGLTFTSPKLATREINAQPDTVAFLDMTPDSLTFSQLERQIELLRKSGSGKLDVVREAEVSLWNKISLPMASLVMALIGAPLGFRPQRAASKGSAVAAGLVIIFSFYFLFKLMDILTQNGYWDPFYAAFLPDVAGLVVAGILVYKVTT